jgi:hypothetical protein
MRLLIIALEDLNERMPRDEARDIFERVKEIGRAPLRLTTTVHLWLPLALSLDPKLELEIMGSYRR